ncbi:MAG: hypothetical protein ABW124_19960, partial [Candidatus Thiodiazotropha sp. 6PLUC9]
MQFPLRAGVFRLRLNGGFIGGQVYRNAGFVSAEGSVGSDDSQVEKRVKQNMGDIVIVTYWKSFEQH